MISPRSGVLNLGDLRYLRSQVAEPIWLVNALPAGKALSGKRYQHAVADAALAGAQWSISLDADFASHLLAGGRVIVLLANYTDYPVEDVTLHVRGHWTQATMCTPGGGPLRGQQFEGVGRVRALPLGEAAFKGSSKSCDAIMLYAAFRGSARLIRRAISDGIAPMASSDRSIRSSETERSPASIFATRD